MKPTYEQLERERNELAAQVERLLSEVVILTKESTYKAFVRFCESNRHYDLDPRLHTHGGGISVGGYISDYDTAKMFAAFKGGVAWASNQRPQEADNAKTGQQQP